MWDSFAATHFEESFLYFAPYIFSHFQPKIEGNHLFMVKPCNLKARITGTPKLRLSLAHIELPSI